MSQELLRVLLGFAYTMVVVLTGFIGWYFGQIGGYEAARVQFAGKNNNHIGQNVLISPSNGHETHSSVELMGSQSVVPAKNQKILNGELTVQSSMVSSNIRSKTSFDIPPRLSAASLSKEEQAAKIRALLDEKEGKTSDNSGENSKVPLLKIPAERRESRLVRSKDRATLSVARVGDQLAKCRRTLGRLAELKQIIELGGRGSKSQFCKEYKVRVLELGRNGCEGDFVGWVCE